MRGRQKNKKGGKNVTVITGGCYNERYFFEASGHAFGDEKSMPSGDTVNETGDGALACAAASILVLTAVEKIERMQSEGAFLSSSINVEPGYACLDVDVREERAEELAVIFDTLLLGFELLEENYPDCISVR